MEQPVGPRPETIAGASNVDAETAAATPSPFWRSPQFRWRVLRTSVAYWISIAFIFAGNALAARGLGPRDYGTMVLALASTALVATLLDFTLEEGLIHQGSKALVAGNFRQLRFLFAAGLAADLVLGLVVFGLASLASPWFAQVLGADELTSRLVVLAAFVSFTATLDGTTGAALTLVRQYERRMVVAALAAVIRLFLILAVRSRGPSAVLAAMALGGVIGSLLQGGAAWWYAWRRWRPDAEVIDRRGVLRGLVVFGAHSSVSTSVQSANTQLVPMLIGRFVGVRSVGFFDVATMPIAIGNMLTGPTRLTLFTENARAWASGDRSTVRRSLIVYSSAAVAVGSIAAVVGWFLLPLIIGAVYSPQFKAAVGPARVLLVAAIARLVTSIAKTFPAAIGRPGLRTFVSIVELCLSVAIVGLLASRGLTAAATGVTIVAVTVAALWVVLVLRVLHEPPAGGRVGSGHLGADE